MVSENTGKPMVRVVVLRQIAHLIDSAIFYVGYLFPLWDAKRQTLADKIMATVCLRLDRAAELRSGVGNRQITDTRRDIRENSGPVGGWRRWRWRRIALEDGPATLPLRDKPIRVAHGRVPSDRIHPKVAGLHRRITGHQ